YKFDARGDAELIGEPGGTGLTVLIGATLRSRAKAWPAEVPGLHGRGCPCLRSGSARSSGHKEGTEAVPRLYAL
ncbi:MAG TPA: hypothetical protein VJJ46_03365, partial [Anaerolineales bacterium]|nr:hypothetical protein [Anaerolineales bacterium]